MVKTSQAVSSDDSNIIKTTTIREVVPAAEAGGRKTPDFFEFVRSIPDDKMGDYAIHLYRVEPTRIPIDHTYGKTFDVPGYGLVPITNIETIETAVAHQCGGGMFRLMCTKRSTGEWQTQQNFRIDLAPRNIIPWFSLRGEPSNSKVPLQHTSGDPVAGQAVQAMSSVQNAMLTPVLEMWKTATSTVKDFTNRPTVPTQPDEWERKLREVVLERALAPPPPVPDPIEQMTRFLTFKQQLDGGNGGTGRELDLDRMRSLIAFAREFSGSASPAVSIGAEILRSVTNVVPNIVEGVNAWARGKEAERDYAAILRSQPQPRPPAPTVRAPQVLPAPVPAYINSTPTPTPTPPSPQPQPQPVTQPPTQPTSGAPSWEYIEQKIVEIFRKPCSAEEAASETLDFLENLIGDNPAPEHDVVSQLAAMGEYELTRLFHDRPNLRPATANTGRLLDFIRAFLRYHGEDVARGQVAMPKPN